VTIAEEERKTEVCCGDLYGYDPVRMLLGESWHPGGLGLTGRLAQRLGISSGEVILDVACGLGTSALFLAKQLGCYVMGADSSLSNVSEASRSKAFEDGLTEFAVMDSRHISLASKSVDAAILECVLSIFADKREVLGEVARVLKPGGRVGVTDVVIEGELPAELKEPRLQAFCISEATSAVRYREVIEGLGFEMIAYEDRKNDAMEFVEEIRKKLFLARMLSGIGKLPVSRTDLEQARRLLMLVRRSVEEGKLGYAMLVARKPGTA